MDDVKKEWLRQAAEWRRFEGGAEAFWPGFLEVLVGVGGGVRGLVLVAGEGEAAGTWKPFCRWPKVAGAFQLPIALDGADFERLVDAARDNETASGFRIGGGDLSVVVVALETGEKAPDALGLVVVEARDNRQMEAACESLASVRDVPAVYQRARGAEVAMADAERLEGVLDVLAEVNRHPKFLQAAMAVCNEVATRWDCSRVSLGWADHGYVRLKAVSNMDRFDKKMDAVQQLEDCLEEAVDQECEVYVPAENEATFLSRHHEVFRAGHGDDFLATVPFRKTEAGMPRGGLILERSSGAFDESDLAALRVLADQLGPRLETLKVKEKWWVGKLAGWGREKLAGFLGPERTWAKLGGVVGCVALLVMIFWRVEYRVEAPFIIRSDDMTYLSAPFDGYISAVEVRVGDVVKEGDVLVSLDTRDLVLSETSTVAQAARYRGEAEKAESERRLADMRVSLALKEQEDARLELIRHRLGQAEIEATIDGVVVYGDLRDKIGKAVKQADLLMQLTRLDELYVELKIPERDIQDVMDSKTGEIAFASMPELKFDVELERIEPSAVPDEGGNVFLARALAVSEIEDWWRPGMAGVTKVNAGKRSLLWIFTHRLVDFLRMKLWW